MEKEKWKDIPGYEGDYKVSTLGRIVSFKKINSRFLSTSQTPSGYLTVCLSRGNIRTTKTIHSLVAGAFIKMRGKGEVNHVNGVKSDNRLINLEICSHSHNISHAVKLGLIITPQKKRSIVREDGRVFPSIVSAAYYSKVHATNIGRVLHGRRKKCGGYTWKYSGEL